MSSAVKTTKSKSANHEVLNSCCKVEYLTQDLEEVRFNRFM